MGIINKMIDVLLGETMSEPEFIKPVNVEDNKQIIELNELLDKVGDNDKDKINEELIKVKSGIAGEKNIEFELKQIRDIPFYCLHDIRLVNGDEVAQLDFVLVMRHCILILESKRMYGNVNIDNEGNFVRQYQDYKHNVYKKEGMYSPITQNKRHVDVVSRMLEKEGFKKLYFSQLVVIANDKTVVDKRFAPKHIKDVIVKYDQLTEKVRNVSIDTGITLNDKEMKEIANFFLLNNNPIKFNYVEKLGLKLSEPKVEVKVDDENIEIVDDDLYEALKKYRYNKAKEKNLLKVQYYIFNNDQLSELVLNRPVTKEAFIAIKGFGENKYSEYGEDIIAIIKEHTREEMLSINEELLEELKKYRYKKAKEMNMLDKQGFILTNAQLEEIATLKYDSLEKLENIPGVGKAKMNNYGNDIITIVKKYIK